MGEECQWRWYARWGPPGAYRCRLLEIAGNRKRAAARARSKLRAEQGGRRGIDGREIDFTAAK
jgi:hypothetical protein